MTTADKNTAPAGLPMMIADELIALRAPEPADLDAMFRWENGADKPASSPASAPLSRKQLWDYIDGYDADIYSARQLRLVIVRRADGARLGAVDLTDFDPRDRRAWVGIYIEESERRRGYGLRALRLISRHARQVIGMHQLAAIVLADNSASRALFDAAGFKTCGRLRSWVRRGRSYIDAQILQLLFEV